MSTLFQFYPTKLQNSGITSNYTTLGRNQNMALYAPASRWFFETPIGQCGVASFHTQYSFLYYGRVTIEVPMPFEEAKAAYPIYSVTLAILGLLLCYAVLDLIFKSVRLYRKLRLKLKPKPFNQTE